MRTLKKYIKLFILFSASILLFALALIIYLDDPSESTVFIFLILIGISLILEELVRPYLHNKGKGRH